MFDIVIAKEISFDRANKAIKILENKALNYTLKDEKEAKIISGFLSKNYDQRKAESLIRQYKTKINKGTTNVTFNHKYSSDRYLILPGNSLDTQFPEGTLINGIFTSIPYFNIINYAENGIVPEQLDLGHELEIGREKKREDFVKNIVDVRSGDLCRIKDHIHKKQKEFRIMTRDTMKIRQRA